MPSQRGVGGRRRRAVTWSDVACGRSSLQEGGDRVAHHRARSRTTICRLRMRREAPRGTTADRVGAPSRLPGPRATTRARGRPASAASRPASSRSEIALTEHAPATTTICPPPGHVVLEPASARSCRPPSLAAGPRRSAAKNFDRRSRRGPGTSALTHGGARLLGDLGAARREVSTDSRHDDQPGGLAADATLVDVRQRLGGRARPRGVARDERVAGSPRSAAYDAAWPGSARRATAPAQSDEPDARARVRRRRRGCRRHVAAPPAASREQRAPAPRASSRRRRVSGEAPARRLTR